MTTTINQLRSQYRTLRDNAIYIVGVEGISDWDSHVKGFALESLARELGVYITPEEAPGYLKMITPEQWVTAAQAAAVTCPNCIGGRWKSPTGNTYRSCFRCDGKGHQTAQDMRRNKNYDNYRRAI